MDLDTYFRFVIALVFVIALFVVLALVLRRLGYGGTLATPSRQRRLHIVEVLPLDTKRRLVLVRRDTAEHLLLLSGSGDLVVESVAGTSFRNALSTAGESPRPAPQPAAPDGDGDHGESPR